MDSLTCLDCRRIPNEVFECDDPEALEERGDAFFGLLPLPGAQIPLAESSPLKPTVPQAEETPLAYGSQGLTWGQRQQFPAGSGEIGGLDADLDVDSIRHPERFPRVSRVMS